MDKGSRNFQMEIAIKVIMSMVNLQDMESITGQMVITLKDIFLMVLEMEKEYGKKDKEKQITMKEILKMIRNGDLVPLLG